MLRLKKILYNMQSSFAWALLDIKCKYRRSVIGPFWETINVFVIIMGVSYVSSIIFGGDPTSSVPFVGLGIIIWTTLSGLVTEGSLCFINNKESIKNSPIPADLYVGRVIFRLLITAAHHMTLYFIGLLLLPIPLNAVSLLSLVGIAFLVVNAFWVVPTLGLLSARFRDLEMMIRSLLQLAFFITPVFWSHSIITDHRIFIVHYNPLFYFLEAIRAPLLGEVLPLSHYIIMSGITLAGYLMLLIVYRTLRRTLAFYV